MTERVAEASARLRARIAGVSYLIILGAIYTAFVLVTMPGAWAFYLFLGGVDVVLTTLIVGYAWKWPKQEAT